MNIPTQDQPTFEEKKAARRFVWILVANMFSFGHLLSLVIDPFLAGVGVIAFVIAVVFALRVWGKRLPAIQDPILRRERGLRNMNKILLAGLVTLGLIWTARFLLFPLRT